MLLLAHVRSDDDLQCHISRGQTVLHQPTSKCRRFHQQAASTLQGYCLLTSGIICSIDCV